MQVNLSEVIENKNIAHNIFRLKLRGNIVKEMNTAGQFVNVRVSQGKEYLLRRPISLCEINPKDNSFVMIFRAEGAGTKILSQLKVGDEVDVLGPLGKGYDLSSLTAGQTALIVGGGIGVPPLYELAKQFNQKGVKTIHVLGFNSQKDVFYEEEFSKLGKTYVATVDGSYGKKGFVTDIIRDYELVYDKYYACGPLSMLNALKNMDEKKEGFVSLEERMACGVGACYACVCKTKTNDTARVCFDGPVFKAQEIIFRG